MRCVSSLLVILSVVGSMQCVYAGEAKTPAVKSEAARGQAGGRTRRRHGRGRIT